MARRKRTLRPKRTSAKKQINNFASQRLPREYPTLDLNGFYRSRFQFRQNNVRKRTRNSPLHHSLIRNGLIDPTRPRVGHKTNKKIKNIWKPTVKDIPSYLTTCVSRKIRKQVLFAKSGGAIKRDKHKKKRITDKSFIRC